MTIPEPPAPLAACGDVLLPGCVEAPPPPPVFISPDGATPGDSPPFLPKPPPSKPPLPPE